MIDKPYSISPSEFFEYARNDPDKWIPLKGLGVVHSELGEGQIDSIVHVTSNYGLRKSIEGIFVVFNNDPNNSVRYKVEDFADATFVALAITPQYIIRLIEESLESLNIIDAQNLYKAHTNLLNEVDFDFPSVAAPFIIDKIHGFLSLFKINDANSFYLKHESLLRMANTDFDFQLTAAPYIIKLIQNRLEAFNIIEAEEIYEVNNVILTKVNYNLRSDLLPSIIRRINEHLNNMNLKEARNTYEMYADRLSQSNYSFQTVIAPYMPSTRARNFGLTSLYHISHNLNLNNLCRYGILSHTEAYGNRFTNRDISDHSVQELRTRREPCFKRQISEYAPLYINPRNPMLSARRELREQICIVEVDSTILDDRDFLITDGNAAAKTTKFFSSSDDFDQLPWDVLNSGSWIDRLDGKRKMCAEVLIYPSVPGEYFKKLHFYSEIPVDLQQEIAIPMQITPNLFF